MNKRDVKKLLKGLKPHPLFEGLPEELKDQACYEGIEKRLTLALYSDHTHKSVKAYAKCAPCASKVGKRRELLKEIGFVSYEQYLEWKRVMDIIINDRPIKVA